MYTAVIIESLKALGKSRRRSKITFTKELTPNWIQNIEVIIIIVIIIVIVIIIIIIYLFSLVSLYTSLYILIFSRNQNIILLQEVVLLLF